MNQRSTSMLHTTRARDDLDAPRGRSAVVVADSGAAAEVLVFPPAEKMTRGSQFQHQGALWVVTGNRRDSGILVATPVRH